MKDKTITIITCVAITVFGGCTDRQMTGTMFGTSIGGIFGSSIGGLMGGSRGSDAGTAIGMIAGGVIGNAVTSTPNQSQRTKQRYDRDECDDDQYNESHSSPSQNNIEGLVVENIRFIDENRNQRLDAGEKAKILFEIHNHGKETLYNVTPVVTCDNQKYIDISPTAIVGNINPGKGVTYTAALIVSPRLKNGMTTFKIAFRDGNRMQTFKTFQIATKSKR